jgi:hypothetical protein
MPSAFEALEGLDDDIDATALAHNARRPLSKAAPAAPASMRLGSRPVCQADVPTARTSCSGHQGFQRSPSPQRSLAQPLLPRRTAAMSSQPSSASSPSPTLQPDPPATISFAAMLKRKGLWDHNRFTNAMNPVTRTHDPSLRPAYALLAKPEQQALWRMIPRAQVAGKHKCQAAALPASAAAHAVMGSLPVPGVRPVLGLQGGPANALASNVQGSPLSRSARGPLATALASIGKRSHQAGGLSRSPVHENVAPALGQGTTVRAEGERQEREAMTCVVCLDRERDALLMPCRHSVLCLMCAFQVRECSGECPYCRRGIEDIMELQKPNSYVDMLE